MNALRALSLLVLLAALGYAQQEALDRRHGTAGLRNAFTTVPPPAIFEFSDILGTYPTSSFAVEWSNFPT